MTTLEALKRGELAEVRGEMAPRPSLLADLGQALATARDVTQSVHILLAHVVPALASTAMVALLDHDGVVEAVATRAGLLDAPPETLDIAPKSLPSAHFSLLRAALARPRAAGGCAAVASDGALQMFALVDGERVLGALWTDGEMPPQSEAMLCDVASYATLALTNACLRRDLQAHAARRHELEAQLDDAERRKVEFLAMLAHELRNPLAPVRNAVEVVRLLAHPEPKLHWAADIIDRQVRQLTRLVDQLLDVSRIGQGKIELQAERIDLASLVAQCADLHRSVIASRRQHLEMKLPDAPLDVFADPARLTQVVQDLLGNAAKFTPEGGRLQVSVAPERSPEGEFATLVVSDDGIGIDADLLPRVFDLFEQGKRALDRTQGGLGVGLTLVQRLVALHGGTVQAHSDGTGRGATFRVRLPCASVGCGMPIADDAAQPSSNSRGGRRILVVEDNADVAESTSMLLTLFGHDVRCAKDGLQALRQATAFEPEVVLLDIGLPLMDGYEVARRLRGMPQTRGALLVALTGYGQPGDRQRGKEAGFDGHLLKPVDPQALGRLIDG